MSWTDWVILGVVTIGFIMFLYGANYYNATVGWAGVTLFIGGIIFYFILFLYKTFKKNP